MMGRGGKEGGKGTRGFPMVIIAKANTTIITIIAVMKFSKDGTSEFPVLLQVQVLGFILNDNYPQLLVIMVINYQKIAHS